MSGAGAALGALTLGGLGATTAAADDETLALGEDVTYSEMNRSKAGEVINGLSIGTGSSTGNRTTKMGRADVSALTGLGNARYWAEVGRRFRTEGDQSQSAVVSANGDVAGSLRGFVGSAAQGIIHLKVVNVSRGTSTQDVIYRAGGQAIGTRTVDDEYSGSITAQLEPNENYIVWLRMTARIDLLDESVSVLPRSNFFTDGQGMFVDEISVRF
ncbi:hypothetical protein ACNS7O_03450 [Haloferacaceae archaeon DSL9]